MINRLVNGDPGSCIPGSNECPAVYNVLSYGAQERQQQNATKAIATAIDAASKKGGGTIYFPAEKYLTGLYI
jgi:polygalacturonase